MEIISMELQLHKQPNKTGYNKIGKCYNLLFNFQFVELKHSGKSFSFHL